jgi:predicted RNase H-like HicB family nuclease
LRYKSIAEAAPEGGWVIAVPSLEGAITQGEDWADAEYMARDLIATVFNAPIDTIEVDLTEVGSGGVDSVVEAWHATVVAA